MHERERRLRTGRRQRAALSGGDTMRFLTIFSAPERDEPPSMDEMVAMGKLIDEMATAGVLVTTEGCKPSAAGSLARRVRGQTTVTDGPFSEAKEVVGGFA